MKYKTIRRKIAARKAKRKRGGQTPEALQDMTVAILQGRQKATDSMSLRVSPALKKRIAQAAEAESETPSYMAVMLMTIGLEAYQWAAKNAELVEKHRQEDLLHRVIVRLLDMAAASDSRKR